VSKPHGARLPRNLPRICYSAASMLRIPLSSRFLALERIDLDSGSARKFPAGTPTGWLRSGPRARRPDSVRRHRSILHRQSRLLPANFGRYVDVEIIPVTTSRAMAHGSGIRWFSEAEGRFSFRNMKTGLPVLGGQWAARTHGENGQPLCQPSGGHAKLTSNCSNNADGSRGD
jgi:hypothetical protein